MSPSKIKFIGMLNIISLSYTLVLLLMKMALIDCSEMRKDLFSFFDLGIITLSLIEIAVSSLVNKNLLPSAFASLFILKIMIYFKSVRSSSSFKDYY
jgi:hypothetical protein